MWVGKPLRLLFSVALAGMLVLGGSMGGPADTSASERPELKAQLRRPVALVLADQGKWLFVANQRSGSISVIDTSLLTWKCGWMVTRR